MKRKRCNHCGLKKPIGEFYGNRKSSDGLSTWCRECTKESARLGRRKDPQKVREQHSRWVNEHRERVRSHQRNWRKRHRTEILVAEKQKRAATPKHIRSHNAWAKWLWTAYRVRPEWYEAKLKEQGGCCAICGKPPLPNRRLGVDHDHETGENRGLLDNSCNTALERLENIENWNAKAQAYINAHRNPERATVLLPVGY